MTYNHENFIRQCLDGFVMQKTTFLFEILVHEDASTDNTAQIVKVYEAKYPGLFRCVYQTENQFQKQNTLINILFPMARGKHIALCEGDDYWTDPYKLQKQVDFLEANEDFVISHHNMKIIYDDDRKEHLSNSPDQKEITTIEDLALGNYIYTASCVFRNGLINEFPSWGKNLPVGDYVLHLLNAQFGKIKYFPVEMGVYRVTKSGLWGHKSLIDMQLKWINILNVLIGKFDEKVNNLLFEQKTLLMQGIIDSVDKIVAENQRNKENYERIINSYSYKFGAFLLKPFSKLKKKLND